LLCIVVAGKKDYCLGIGSIPGWEDNCPEEIRTPRRKGNRTAR